MLRDRHTLAGPQRAIVLLMLATLALPVLLAVASEYLPSLRPGQLVGENIVAKPQLSWAKLRSGAFQHATEARFAQLLPPRATAVQLTNELYLDLLGRSYMYDGQILLGRAGTLFERGYIDSRCRADEPFDDAGLRRTIARIGRLQRRLAAAGRVLLFVSTPSKAMIMPELLPPACPPPADPGRRHRLLLSMLSAEGIPTIDGEAALRAMKRSDPLPPFSVRGTHWSNLAAQRVAGIVMDELSRLAGIDLGGVGVTDIRWDAPPTGQDGDLARLLNLFLPRTERVGAGRLVCRTTAAGRRDGLIAEGGSFLDTIVRTFAECGLFAYVDYFFYYTDGERRWPDGAERAVDRATLDWRRRLATARVLLLDLNDAAIGGAPVSHVEFLDDVEAALR